MQKNVEWEGAPREKDRTFRGGLLCDRGVGEGGKITLLHLHVLYKEPCYFSKLFLESLLNKKSTCE